MTVTYITNKPSIATEIIAYHIMNEVGISVLFGANIGVSNHSSFTFENVSDWALTRIERILTMYRCTILTKC